MERTGNATGYPTGPGMGGIERAMESRGEDQAPERIRKRLRQLEEDLRKTAVDIYRQQSTPRDIALGSMSAMVTEARIKELEWVLSQIE